MSSGKVERQRTGEILEIEEKLIKTTKRADSEMIEMFKNTDIRQVRSDNK